MLGHQLNLMRTTYTEEAKLHAGEATVMSRWTQGALAKYYGSDQSDLRAAKAHDKR